MPEVLPPAVSAALAALEATSVSAGSSARADKWLAVARAWTEAAAEATAAGAGGASAGDGNTTATAPTPDATECHERAYAAYATGLRELERHSGHGATAQAEALSSGRMAALAALAAVPPAPPAPLLASSPRIKRVLVLSDLHVDQPLTWRCGCFENTSSSSRTGMDWVRGLSAAERSEEEEEEEGGCLVVAGDVADSLPATLAALAELKRRFARVFYCPGNHELYLRGSDAEAFPDSWCKLFTLRRACARLGVETSPAAVAGGGSGGAVVVVAPLLSWYDDGAFCGDQGGLHSHHLRFDAPCAWGPVREGDVHRVMLSLAKREMATAARAAASAASAAASAAAAGTGGGGGGGVNEVVLVTATHFLPRRELPFHRGVMDSAMGCALLGEAVLPALSGAVFGGAGGGGGGQGKRTTHIHAYGHSHIHCDRVDVGGDGVRYVQRALGAGPSSGDGRRRGVEASSASASASAGPRSTCTCFEPLLVWEAPSS